MLASELNEKILRLAGFEFVRNVRPSGSIYYDKIVSPDGKPRKGVPSFRFSIGACLKWVEPLLYERFGIYHIGFGRIEGVGYTCFMYRKAVEWPYRFEGRSKELSTIGYGETLGVAFCDAALQVSDKYPELEVASPSTPKRATASAIRKKTYHRRKPPSQ